MYGVTPRVTSGATSRATPKMMYYSAYTTQTAARFEGDESGDEAAMSRVRPELVFLDLPKRRSY